MFFFFVSQFLEYIPQQFDDISLLEMVDFWLISAIILVRTNNKNTMNKNNVNLCKNSIISDSTKRLHQQFVTLGRERNKITYKLLSLLPQIYKQKIYETHGYATIYEYAGKLAGLSRSVVEKALKLENKLKDKPTLQKAIETQGVHKVSIVANIATPENEKMFADKVENMSKAALQQFSKEYRGKIQTNWQIEMDAEMMTTFLKLKEKIGKNLSNKEAFRRLLNMMAKSDKSYLQAKNIKKIPGENSLHPQSLSKISPKITRYIPVAQKREILTKTNHQCSHKNCLNPAQILHHQIRFFQTKNHDSVVPLCKIHHEFAHNGLSETMTEADLLYRKCRQESLI